MQLKQFLKTENIPHYSIYYYLNNEGKKIPIGEKNNISVDEIPAQEYKNKQMKLPDLTKSELSTLQQAYTLFLKHTDNVYCVDIDMENINSMQDFINITGCDLFKNCCWVKGNTKGIHIYVKINNMIHYSNQQAVYKDFDGDLIKKNNMWERIDKDIFGYENGLTTFEYDDIKDIFNDRLNTSKNTKKLNIKVPSATAASPSSITEIDTQTSDEKIELLDIIRIEPKNREWLRICSCLKTNNYTNNDWLRFCNNNSLHMDDEKINLFYNIKTDANLSIYYLEALAKKSNYNDYKDWRIKYKKYLKLKTLEQGSNDLADYIKDKLKNNLVYCNDKWIQYNREIKLWEPKTKPDAIITTHIQREIDESKEMLLCVKNKTEDEPLKKKLEEKEKQYNKFRSLITGCGYMSQLKNYLTTYLCDNNFDKKLDKHDYKMAFKNGMLDLTNFKLVPLCQEHFITKTIPYEWTPANETDKEIVKIILKKITNWNDSHLEYYLSILGYAMTGDSSREQMFWYFRGETAENGKSIIFEVLEQIMPNYVEKSVPEFLDKKYDIKKEVPTWNGKRIVWVNELSTDKKNEDLVKSICDGTDYKYNRNYSIESQKVSIGFKLFAVSNNSLNIKADNGIIRRFRLCQFGSQFKADNVIDDYENLQFINDKDLRVKLMGPLRNALLGLIFDYSKKYYEDKCLKAYPNEWRQDANEVMEDNNKFQTWFNDTFDIGKDYKIFKPDFENIIPIEFKNIKIRDELKRMKIPHEYKSQHVEYEPRRKGWWFGFDLKKDEEKEIQEI
jgi:hypothetical protein